MGQQREADAQPDHAGARPPQAGEVEVHGGGDRPPDRPCRRGLLHLRDGTGVSGGDRGYRACSGQNVQSSELLCSLPGSSADESDGAGVGPTPSSLEAGK